MCVIGAGPSGYAAAMRAMDFKKKVVLVDKAELGGTGLHDGALSSKTWWELSREYYRLHKNSQVFHFDLPEISFSKFKKEVERAVFERKDFLEHHMRVLAEGGGALTFVRGEASLLSRTEVLVKTHLSKELRIETDNIVLATGSRPRKLPDVEVDGERILTSDDFHNLKDWPRSLVIVGAGVIGCEFATIFSNFGATNVNIIDKGERILPFEDEDVVAIIEKNMEMKGVNIHRNSRLTKIGTRDGEVEYVLEYATGRREIFYVEKAFISVGRVPNHEHLGLEKVGVEMSERGIVDNLTRTNIENIYAVGDITADIALVNVGELEGRYAVERMFSTPERDLIYENISTIMFLHPEVAGVGLNETMAQKGKHDYRVACIEYSCISRAVAMRNTQGFIKILVTDDEEMRILGMRVVGEHASTAIQAVALLISMNKGVEELAELIHPHPSIVEGTQECVRMLLGKSTIKPYVLRENMVCRAYRNGAYVS